MEKEKKRREWIKNALIIFLVVMLVLTFCSNTIMNMYLPEVSTEAVSSGRLKESIRGTGTAEEGKTYEVTVSNARTIKNVYVKNGDEVKEGDSLFEFEKGDETELDTAKSTYLEYQTEYQKKLIGTEYIYTKEELAIESARLEYKKALKVLKNVDANNKKIRNKSKKLNSITAQISSLEKKSASYDADIATLSSGQTSAACNEDLTAKKRILTGLENELSDIDADLATLKNSGAPSAEITEMERARRDKAVEVDNAKADVTNAENALTQATNNEKKLLDLKKKKAETDSKLEEYRTRQTELTAELDTLKAGALSKEEAKASVDEKENAYNSLIADYEIKKAEDTKTQKNDDIDLAAAKEKLDAQKKVVDDLTALYADPVVKAKMGGIVTAVNCVPGDTAQPDTPLATIASDNEALTVKIPVTRQQAQKLKPGQSGEVVNYWDDDIGAILRSITPDTENPSNNILTFDVKGESISAGDSITISIGGEDKQYDLIVPKSSINEDNNGKFILTLDTKNTPLGTRYIATRHEVDVLSENDTYAAISSDLNGYEYVIKTASAAVNSGDQVKLKE